MPLLSMPLHNSDQRQNMSKTWIPHTWLDKLQCYMICYTYTTALPETEPWPKKMHSRKLSRRCNRFHTLGLQNQRMDINTMTRSSILTNSYSEEVGIVINISKNGKFCWAVHQIVVLRAILKCSLPIEVFYRRNKDLPEQYRHFINSLLSSFPSLGSISTIDITKRFPDPDGMLGLPGRWAMGYFVALVSSFKTVISTVTDTMFL